MLLESEVSALNRGPKTPYADFDPQLISLMGQRAVGLVHGCVFEEERDALAIVCTSTSLSQLSR